MTLTPAELDARIETRLEPLIAQAIANQPDELRERIATAQAQGHWSRTYSTEPARADEPGRWVCRITHHIHDANNIPAPLATISAPLVGVVVAGDFGNLEYWYLPDEQHDNDIDSAPIRLIHW